MFTKSSMENPEILPIHRTWILRVFYIIPVVVFITAIDWWYFDAALLPYMGITSLLLPLYLLFFELPHIVASFIGFFDKEYVQFYRRHLLFGLPLLLAGFAILLYLVPLVAIGTYLAATTYHVMRQQTGIALMFGVVKNSLHAQWSWCAVLVTAVMYVALGLPQMISSEVASVLSLVVPLALGALAFLSVRIMHRTSNTFGIRYVAATMVMLLASYTLLSFGYLFLAVFIIRFVHDVTAFMFYITHECNRNRSEIKNIFYQLIPFVPHSLVIIVPSLAIAIGLATREVVSNAEALFIVIMFLSFVHYYLESIMWKRESLHRKQVRLV